MTDPGIPQLQALPDGDAEVSLVVRLQWEDVAALGQDAARLAARWKRPVTLDEAASQRLRIRPLYHPCQDGDTGAGAAARHGVHHHGVAPAVPFSSGAGPSGDREDQRQRQP